MPKPTVLVRAGAVALLAALYLPALYRVVVLLGMLRQPKQTHTQAAELVTIPDTLHCEDLHHHVPSNTLFTACEDSPVTRMAWFPGLAILDDPVKASKSQGSIHTINPKTMKSKRLKLKGFEGGFITHGLEVISDTDRSVYIFAINHLPSPEFLEAHTADPAEAKTYPFKARSQIEVFHHVLGSSTAKHVRSIRHPLLKTPNDIFALSPDTIYVTNDHYYREGRMRTVEDFYSGGRWSNTVLVRIDKLAKAEPASGINVSVAITGLHNNNGLGYSPVGMAIGSAASGELHLARRDGTVVESIPFGTTIDNPSYFRGRNVSGYVLGGLTRACDLANTIHDPLGKEPVTVWFAKETKNGWKKSVIFEDDGNRIRSSSAAVLVEESASTGWLFVTGFLSNNIVAAKVDLASLA